MKRSTLILILLAAALGAFVYFHEVKGGKAPDEETETSTSKPPYSVKQEDIVAVTLTRGDEKILMEKQNGKWLITGPVRTQADQAALDALTREIADARVERNIAAAGDEIRSYGLAEPAVTIEVRLKDGRQHRLRLGAQDFSGQSVYGQVDQSQEVALLPASLLTSSNKSLNDLRDRSVFDISEDDIDSFKLSNENGGMAVAKQDGKWTIKNPVEAAADEGEISSLLGDLTSTKASDFVSETGENLSRYGLDKPKITLTAQAQNSGEQTLMIGAKTGGRYYAKNSAHAQIFTIESSLFERLNTDLAKLRDKQIVSLKEDDLTQIRVKNTNGELVVEKDKDGKWIIKEPAEQKGKEAQSWKLLDPLETTKATEVLDKLTPQSAAKLAQPAVEVWLTDKEGKTTEVKVSPPDGDSAYVKIEGKAEVYKVSKRLVEDLSFKGADLAI